ncbi:hypothetical protein AMJ44_02330 [candidate division WOR-1 bacterium DG_54_3]|uniref:Glycosyltransferase RgtA/B/C/D-like domain-containing protein n=1 Tax=candidate division WOR-1 bacterium DG_54_3 TaxID=1703775 RepID=A0A0S7Y4X7_UNCSA|nr:MAG: hypothetical protein AMJ44_02330 [candidate division WOR-1 bacterium DG_54_3]
MIVINLLITMLIPLVLGMLILALFIQKGSSYFRFWEKIALAFFLGLGFLIILMFLLAVTKIPLTFLNIFITITILSLVICLYLIKKRCFCIEIDEIRNALKISPKLDPLEILLACLITLKIVFVYFIALVKPVVDVDAFQYYSLVARGIYITKTFLTPYLQQFIADKPLLPYLAQGWALIGLHTVNDALMKVLFPTLFLCLIVIFYAVVKRSSSRKMALLFTFLLSTLPFLVYHATTAYADLSITIYYAVATIYLFLFMKSYSLGQKQESYSHLLLAILFLGISVWVKRAGIFLAGINIFVLIGYLLTYRKTIKKDLLRNLLILGGVFVLIIAPWIIYGQAETFVGTIKGIFGKTEISTLPTVAEGPLLDKTDIVLSVLLRKLFLYADWHLLWLLFLVTLIFFYKKSFSRPLVFLLAIILLDISALFFQFRFGGSFIWILDGTLLDRLAMNYVPVVLFFCSEAIIPFITSKTPENR